MEDLTPYIGSIINRTPKTRYQVSKSVQRKNPQTKKKRKKKPSKDNFNYTGSKTPERIVIKFCMMVGHPDIVSCEKLDSDRFGHFCVVRGRISGYSIDFGSRSDTTHWHYSARV